MARKNKDSSTRSNNAHLSETEKEFLRKCFREGVVSKHVADKLGCTVRTIQIHYLAMRNGVRLKVPNPKVVDPDRPHVSTHMHVDYYLREPRKTSVSLSKVSFLNGSDSLSE